MKKFLLLLLCSVGLSAATIAQSFTTQYDTTGTPPGGDTVSGAATITNYITNASTTDSFQLSWQVIASDFPRSWWHTPNLGICDNNNCKINDTTTLSLWNGTKGDSFLSDWYSVATGGFPNQEDFHMVINLAGAAGGTHYMTVHLRDVQTGYSKNITFLITKGYLGVSTVVKSDDDVVLYPNPAINEVNLLYNASAGVKNIAVYNLIGRVMNVYRVSANNSAKLDVSNLPSGIYFVRMMNAQGNVVATRKFTRQ